VTTWIEEPQCPDTSEPGIYALVSFGPTLFISFPLCLTQFPIKFTLAPFMHIQMGYMKGMVLEQLTKTHGNNHGSRWKLGFFLFREREFLLKVGKVTKKSYAHFNLLVMGGKLRGPKSLSSLHGYHFLVQDLISNPTKLSGKKN